jgi:hypothetical protein
MDLSHDLLTALRRGSKLVTRGPGSEPQRAKQLVHFKWLAGRVESAQKFDFTNIQKTFSKELLVTASELLWHDLLPVPFDLSIFNFDLPEEKVMACVLVADKEGILGPIPEGLRGDVQTIWAYGLATPTSPLANTMTPGEWAIHGIMAVLQKDPEDENTFWITPVAFPGFDAPYTDKHVPGGQAARTSELVLQALVCLVARGVKLETSKPSRILNKIRKAAGKAPQFEHKIVVVDPDRIIRESSGDGGTHASPRWHWRRGHVRREHDHTLPSGKVIRMPASTIPACAVGDPMAGLITHDYKV